ncbi:MAG: RsmD family RNA methyltransferase [Leeuwenhoekiella sp.]
MRIISGNYKGRRITAPKKLPVRPTTDMAKESLFNILRNSFTFSQVKVLDLFSGTGNISYEFASRSCTSITAVDQDMGCVRFIEKTANELEMPIIAIKNDVIKFLDRSPGTYDIIFADPPYNLDKSEFLKLADKVFEKELLLPNGVLIIEHSKLMSLDEHPNLQETRKYGSSSFSFFGAK